MNIGLKGGSLKRELDIATMKTGECKFKMVNQIHVKNLESLIIAGQ